jgi:hypothetical protein
LVNHDRGARYLEVDPSPGATDPILLPESIVGGTGSLLPTDSERHTGTHDNDKNVGRKPVTHWHRREREKKRERERNLKGRKRREGGHGSAEARSAEGQAEM